MTQRDPTAWQVEQAFRALMEARAELLAIDPTIIEDQLLLQSCLEGEAVGDPFAVIDGLVRGAMAAADLAALAGKRAQAINERRQRFEAREEKLRTMVQQMLDALGLDRITREDFSVSISDRKGKVIVADENEVPDEYVKLTRTVSKTLIGAALDEGREVPGAYRSNGSRSLTIREH